MKRFLKWAIGIAFLVACIAIVWYHIPTKIQKNVMACTQDGEAIEVEIDLVRQRRMFVPGGVYWDMPYEKYFYIGSYDDIDAFYLHMANGEEQKTYYGEAATVEEVQEIIRRMVGD